jgi:heme-degrading monooxygenase HmoA
VSTNDLRYARRVAFRVKPDQTSNFLEKIRVSVFPGLKEQAGIRRMYLLSTAGGNEFLSVTLWDNKSNADAYGNSEAFAKNTELVRDFLESDPVVSEFDIEFHDVNAEDLPPPKSVRGAKRKSPRLKRKSKKRKSRS